MILSVEYLTISYNFFFFFIWHSTCYIKCEKFKAFFLTLRMSYVTHTSFLFLMCMRDRRTRICNNNAKKDTQFSLTCAL